MSRYLVTIFGKDQKAMVNLVREHKIEVLRQTAEQRDKEGDYSMDALVDDQQIQTLKAGGYEVEIREDIDKVAEKRRVDVGKGDRYRLS
jgi:hypothetical protein